MGYHFRRKIGENVRKIGEILAKVAVLSCRGIDIWFSWCGAVRVISKFCCKGHFAKRAETFDFPAQCTHTHTHTPAVRIKTFPFY